MGLDKPPHCPGVTADKANEQIEGARDQDDVQNLIESRESGGYVVYLVGIGSNADERSGLVTELVRAAEDHYTNGTVPP